MRVHNFIALEPGFKFATDSAAFAAVSGSRRSSCLGYNPKSNGLASGVSSWGPDTEVVSVKLSIVAALAAVLFLSPANAQVGEADITGGRVTGVPADAVVSFKGIPFAAPP